MGEGSKSLTPAASEARKRRKAIIESQRKESEHQNLNNNNSNDDKNKRAQIRYDPDVPMSKEQLAAWRREARRVRNRESAAASRQRTRNRISELESEVREWKRKYEAAMQKIEAYESKQRKHEHNSVEGASTSNKIVAMNSEIIRDDRVNIERGKPGHEVPNRAKRKSEENGSTLISAKTAAKNQSKNSVSSNTAALKVSEASVPVNPLINLEGNAMQSESEAFSETVVPTTAYASEDDKESRKTQQLAAAAAALASAAATMTSLYSDGAVSVSTSKSSDNMKVDT